MLGECWEENTCQNWGTNLPSMNLECTIIQVHGKSRLADPGFDLTGGMEFGNGEGL